MAQGIDVNTTTGTPNQTAFSDRYYYKLSSSDGLSLTVLRDEAPPKVTGGRGGWEVVARRRRKGMTSWVGRDPVSMDVPVLFDGWYDPPFSIAADKETLMQMANGDDFVNPPTITIEGNLPVTGATWVISNLSWGDNQIWVLDEAGNDILVRQDCVISLLQFVQEDVVKILNQKGQPSRYKIQSGDTLRSIAKKKYGDANKWTIIRDANPGIRDPNNLEGGGKIHVDTTEMDHNCKTDVLNFNKGRYSWLNFKKRWVEHKCPGPIPQPDQTIYLPPDN